MPPPALPGQGHTPKDCPCCHADDAHKAFPDGVGGEFVLCEGCFAENWEPLRDVTEKSVQAAREALASNPGSDGHAVVLEIAESMLEILKSKDADGWDIPRLNAACARIRAAGKPIAALVDLSVAADKGTA